MINIESIKSLSSGFKAANERPQCKVKTYVVKCPDAKHWGVDEVAQVETHDTFLADSGVCPVLKVKWSQWKTIKGGKIYG